MKRVAFAWVTFWLDFDTMDEAQAYYINNHGKGFRFPKEPYYNGTNWTVEVEKPYRNYNCGW